MAALLEKIWSASLYGGVIIGVILLLRLVLKGVPRKYICLLWLLAAVRLLVPFELESSFSLQPDMGEVRIPGAARLELVRSSLDSRAEPLILPTEVQPDTQPEQSALAMSSPTVIKRKVPLSTLILENYEEILAWAWLCVALGLVLYSIVSYWRLKRSVRGAVILSEGVWLCPEQNTAFVLGFLRPQIYLPAGLTEQERRLVLLHERAHISRGDSWWKLLGFGVLALHWFNPLVWVAYLCLCKDLEMACDERVVRSMDVAERKAYSLALLSCSANRRSIAACPMAFGEVSVKARIKNVLNYRKPLFWVTLAAVIAIIFVAVCFLTSPKDVTQTPAPDASTEVSNEWGVSLHASNATATGLKLVCIQNGTDVGGTLGTGSYFWLEQWTDSGWVSVEEIPPEEGVERSWTDELWLISQGRTLWDVNWSYLYGELSPGTYRIGKVISLTSDETEGQTQETKLYAQFTFGDTAQPELTEESVSALCAAAYTELHEAGCYAAYEDNGGAVDTYEWYAGDHYYIEMIGGPFNCLSYGESYYYFSPEEAQYWGVPAGWVSQDYLNENQIYGIGSPAGIPFWQMWTWEQWGVAFKDWEESDGALICELMYEGDPATTYILTLDEEGHLTSIEGRIGGETVHTTTFLSLDYDYIESVIAQKYQEASNFVSTGETVLDLATDEELIQRCRDAMQAVLSADELYVDVERLDEYEDKSNLYLRTDRGWLFQYREPGVDCETVKWFSYDGVRYLYDEVLDESGSMVEYYRWKPDPEPESHDFQLPAPFTLNWDEIRLEFEDRQLERGIESITLRQESYGETFIFYFNTLKESTELRYFDVLSYDRDALTEAVRYYVRYPYTYVTNNTTVAERLQTVYTDVAAQINAPAEVRDEAFYEELFTRETDGHYTEIWVSELVNALYREPEAFVRQLSRKYAEDPERVEEIVSFIGIEVQYNAPVRFARLMAQLGENSKLDQRVVELLKNSYQAE